MADAEAAAPAMVEVDIKDEDFVAGRSRKEWETMMPGLMSIMLIAFGAAFSCPAVPCAARDGEIKHLGPQLCCGGAMAAHSQLLRFVILA